MQNTSSIESGEDNRDST